MGRPTGLLVLSSTAATFSLVVLLALLAALANCLLLLFSSLDRGRVEDLLESESEERRELGRKLLQLFEGYNLLIGCLYLLQIASLLAIPLLLSPLGHWAAVGAGCLLAVGVVEVGPRAWLGRRDREQLAGRVGWVGAWAGWVARRVRWDSPLGRLFNRQKEHHTIGRDNVAHLLYMHRQLDYGYRQEEIELLDRFLRLRDLPITSQMVPRRNLLVLDIQTAFTQKLLYQLGKYYFSKVLVSEGHADRIVGFLPLKRLLRFKQGETIADLQAELLDRRIARVRAEGSQLQAVEAMQGLQVNFAVVEGEAGAVGLVKLKEIFSGMLLKWYNYDGLAAERTYYSLGSMGSLSLGRREPTLLEEGTEQT